MESIEFMYVMCTLPDLKKKIAPVYAYADGLAVLCGDLVDTRRMIKKIE